MTVVDNFILDRLRVYRLYRKTLSGAHAALFWSNGNHRFTNFLVPKGEKAMTFRQKTTAVVVPVVLAVTGMVVAGAKPERHQFDAAAAYKKCTGCHGAKAEKKFDPAKADDELVQIILKGKTAEKPPNMPGYEAKGITAEQAQQLVAHMKALRQ
jgi:mono/diheme cytochrome c family protein